MVSPPPQFTREQECERLLSAYGTEPSSLDAIMNVIERQYAVLHNRAQVLLTLCGIVISTTGFSGRIIAGTNRPAQVLVISGVTLVLLSAVVIVWGVQYLTWLTRQPGAVLRDWLLIVLANRDRKTRFYRIGIALMLLGLAAYVAAIAMMLLNPEPVKLPVQ